MAILPSQPSLKHLLYLVVSISIVSFVFFGLYAVSFQQEENINQVLHKRNEDDHIPSVSNLKQKLRTIISSVEERRYNISLYSSVRQEVAEKIRPSDDPALNYNAHIFYYPWYKSEAFDGKYAHWNHEQLLDWKIHKNSSRRRQYVPPGDIGANFYPELGPYSSANPHVIETHMKQIRNTGVGVVCVSWYPPQHENTNETPVDDLMMPLFEIAAKYGLKITFHIEPYKDRNGKTLNEVFKFIIHKYGNHSAFYRTSHKGRKLPVYYVYDSYQIDASKWADALKPKGLYSIRNTKYDALVLGLVVKSAHLNHLSSSGFDGFYTYFASNGFSYGSSWKNWGLLAHKANKTNLIFVPSIGPGYLDTRVRPWNGKNARLRLKGQYYQSSFRSALATRPQFLSITSFNEWHEGTQVEPAVPKMHNGFKYVDYLPNKPDFYLNLTRTFVAEYKSNMSHPIGPSHGHDNAL